MRRFQITIAALLLLVAGSIGTRSAMANPVTYAFIETSCVSTNGGCVFNHDPAMPIPLPVTIGLLTVSDINSSGFYTAVPDFPNPPITTDSGNFNLVIAGLTVPISNAFCGQV